MSTAQRAAAMIALAIGSIVMVGVTANAGSTLATVMFAVAAASAGMYLGTYIEQINTRRKADR